MSLHEKEGNKKNLHQADNPSLHLCFKKWFALFGIGRERQDLLRTQREKRECTSGKLPCALAYASRSSADTPCVRRPGNARESDYCVQVISALGKPCKHKYVHFLRTPVAPAHTLVHGRFTTCKHACINCIPAYQDTLIKKQGKQKKFYSSLLR